MSDGNALMKAIRRLLTPLPAVSERESVEVLDQGIIDRFKADPHNPFLISFPRTGSHWVRMLMELYFGRPSLVRVFYFPERDDYLTYHTHDLDLTVEHADCIYLYRSPVDTVYSQLQYYSEPLDDMARITHWSDLYGRHLEKWILRETFTTHKTIIRYDLLRRSLAEEFAKVCRHFGMVLDEDRLRQAASRVSKQALAKKTEDDPHVVNLTAAYVDRRAAFRSSQGPYVVDCVFRNRPELREAVSASERTTE